MQFAIAPQDRHVLHERIEQRFHKMIELGFQAEVEKLYARGDLNINLPSIRCVGYRQMWEYLQGDYAYEGNDFPWYLCNAPTCKTPAYLAAWLENTNTMAR